MTFCDVFPSPKLAPSWGQVIQVAKFLGLGARSQLLTLKGGGRGMLKAPGLD